MANIVSVENITSKIFMIRGIKVMLDRDLAELYGVETKRLKEQVRRNISRFPEDFMFELSEDEEVLLRSQFATLKGKGKRIEEHLESTMISSVWCSRRSGSCFPKRRNRRRE